MGKTREYDEARLVYLAHHRGSLYMLLVSASPEFDRAYWQLPGGARKKDDLQLPELTIDRIAKNQLGMDLSKKKEKIFHTEFLRQNNRITSVCILEEAFDKLPIVRPHDKHTRIHFAHWFRTEEVLNLKFHRKHIGEKHLALECAELVTQDGLIA